MKHISYKLIIYQSYQRNYFLISSPKLKWHLKIARNKKQFDYPKFNITQRIDINESERIVFSKYYFLTIPMRWMLFVFLLKFIHHLKTTEKIKNI